MKYYLDTEFDGLGGKLISFALVREDGNSVSYVVQDYADDPWVQANVIPILWDANASTRLWYAGGSRNGCSGFSEGRSRPGDHNRLASGIRYFCGLIEFPGGNMGP